ncbi:hypothetical protein IFT73_08030 [Aeromicrobium sp. CFBP 8757]|uniref:DUF6286 domain-containing protein n=1 Tax=Aeromicrobium sp. CFBP 8757 TaxID=2775288 RepID=UPI00177C5DB8|nr:hypothetical protein [Aeromicrobium sp. CFBP 8757]
MSARVTPPTGRPGASGASLLLGVALIGLAVVSVHDLAVDRGWAGGPSWTGSLLDAADGLTAGTGVVVAAVAAVAIGLILLVVAFKPAPRTHESTPGPSDVWVTRKAVRAVAVGAAEDTAGVAAARATHRRGRVVVTVQSDRPDAAPHVEASVREALAGLTARDVAIRTTEVKHDA